MWQIERNAPRSATPSLRQAYYYSARRSATPTVQQTQNVPRKSATQPMRHTYRAHVN